MEAQFLVGYDDGRLYVNFGRLKVSTYVCNENEKLFAYSIQEIRYGGQNLKVVEFIKNVLEFFQL
jgi:hypothetical protein